MPKQSRGFWTCDYCGHPWDTIEEAKAHESTQCPSRPSRPSPAHHQHPRSHQTAMPPSQGAHYFAHPPPPPPGIEHHQHHHMPSTTIMHTPSGMPMTGMPPQHGGPPGIPPYALREKTSPMEPPFSGGPHSMHRKIVSRCVSLLGPHETSRLAMEDAIACQNVELFEATEEHAADADVGRTGGAPVTVGQVGLRCIHCASSPLSSAVYNMVFPGSLEAIASSVRMIADQHLSTCGMAPPEIQEACERAAAKRKAEMSPRGPKAHMSAESERAMAILMDFCLMFCQRMQLVNKRQPNTGIKFVSNGRQHDMETPASRASMMNGAMSGDRSAHHMTDRIGYLTPGQSGYPMRQSYSSTMSPGDEAQQTPLPRRRDRHGDPGDAPQSQPHPGYNGYSGQPGQENPYPPSAEPVPQHGSSEPTADGHTPPGGGHGSYPGQVQQYEIPYNFPFYQDPNGGWQCRYCSHVHPQYREPQSIWSHPTGGPPPNSFIDQHLSMCRAYLQSMSQPAYQGAPPGYGGPYGQPGYPGWDLHAPMNPYHGGQEVSSPYGSYPGGLMEGAPHAPRYAETPSGHAHDSSQHHRMVQQQQGTASSPFPPVLGERPGQHNDTANDAIALARKHLAANDKEEYNIDANGNQLPKLVIDEDRLLLTDYFFFLMKQLRLCRFSESDRKTRGGKREKIKIGYGGLQCVHCADMPNSRKFFWSNVDRLANSFAEIPGHILKCRRCTQQTKDALLQLKQYHPEQMARLARGSQKVFFRRMWRRLHDEDSKAQDATSSPQEQPEPPVPLTIKTGDESGIARVVSKGTSQYSKSDSPATKDSDESNIVVQRSYQEAAKALASAYMYSQVSQEPLSPSSRVLLAIPDDKEWLSDMDCFIRKQLEVFCANDQDVTVAKNDKKQPVQFGQVGIRCIHCSLRTRRPAIGQAVAYPYSINNIYESVREFQRLHLDSCENVPDEVRNKLSSLNGSSSLSSVLRKYYVLAAKALGLEDTKDGIRAGGESVPLGSKAVFSFAEGHDENGNTSIPGTPRQDSSSPGSGKRKRESDSDTMEKRSHQRGNRKDPATAT